MNTPLIPNEEFQARRARLLEQMEPGSVLLLPSAEEVLRNGDAHYPYRQDSDFYYLTGYDEPEALLVLRRDSNTPFTLFCRPRDPDREQWDGPRLGVEGAREHLGADRALPIADLQEQAEQLIADTSLVYLPWDGRLHGVVNDWISGLSKQVRFGVRPPPRLASAGDLIHEMRLIKSSAEVDVMRHSASIAAGAHSRAMRAVQPGMIEYQLEAEYLHEFAVHGARQPAYSSIVGAGSNACVLHYISNDATMQDGDMVLVDAGCEYQGYASDITRTFPVNGRFTAEQGALYQAVLNVQKSVIEALRPGLLKQEVEQMTARLLTAELVDLKILSGEVDALVEQQAYRAYYMHSVSHWLGIDVHDVGAYIEADGSSRVLRSGMVLTIEPGLYISASDAVDAKWHDIGVRIEDDILITDKGSEVLSSGVPKEIAEIEQLMAAAG